MDQMVPIGTRVPWMLTNGMSLPHNIGAPSTSADISNE